MPRIARPTRKQILAFGRLTREGPGDPLVKRTLIPNSAGSGVCCSPASTTNPRWFAYEEQQPQAITRAASVMAQSTATGTASAFNDATGSYINYLSTTALNSVAGLQGAATNLVQIRHLPDILIVMKTGAGANDIANLRIWIGMHDDGSLGTDTPGTLGFSGLVFRYSTPAGDSNWMAGSFDGASQTFLSTGVAVVADTRYVFRIKVVSTSSVEYYINGVLVQTIAATLPAAATNMQFGYCHTVNALAGTARNIRWRKTFIDSL